MLPETAAAHAARRAVRAGGARAGVPAAAAVRQRGPGVHAAALRAAAEYRR